MNQNETNIDWRGLVPPIFAACVGESAGKRDISRPFIVGGFLYAVDGKIGVRMPVPFSWRIPNPDPEKVVNKVAEVFEGKWHSAAVPIPPIEGICDGCRGQLILPERECFKCDGSGEEDSSDCDCPHCTGQHDCDVCDGKGTLPPGQCMDCDGSGVDRSRRRVEVSAGYWLARDYCAKLLRSGVSTIQIPEDPNAAKKPARFVIGEAEGVLMPCYPPAPGEEP